MSDSLLLWLSPGNGCGFSSTKFSVCAHVAEVLSVVVIRAKFFLQLILLDSTCTDVLQFLFQLIPLDLIECIFPVCCFNMISQVVCVTVSGHTFTS